MEPLRLAAGDWASSLVVNHLARIVLEERAATRAQVVVDPISNPPDVVARINRGETHTLLETWPDAQDAAESDANRDVDVVGRLGVIARVGWYFPDYMLPARPWLRDLSSLPQPVGATLGSAVFNDNVYAGPLSWASTASCKVGGIFDNLGLGVNCTHLAGEVELVDMLATHYAAHEPFLMYLWRPLDALANFNMTRASLPCWDAACFDALRCDYPETELTKLAYAELHLTFPPLAIDTLAQFTVSVEVVESIAAAALPNRTSEAIGAAACQWAAEHAALLDAMVRPQRNLQITDVQPRVLPARGGATITITGTGFGSFAPATFEAEVGGAKCQSTTWLSPTSCECVAPPGVGEGAVVRLLVGAGSAVADVTLCFEPATLHGFAIAGERASSGGSRAASVGQRVIVMGDNFVRSTLMQCRIGDTVQQATFINFTAVECVVPQLAHPEGTVPIAVSNDGLRWRSGLTLEPTSSIVWPGGVMGLAPLDISSASAPAELVLVSGHVYETASVWPALRLIVRLINDDPSVLRHTRLTLLEPDLSAARSLDTAQMQAHFVSVMAAIRADNPNVVAVAGGTYSSSTIPMAAASAASARPWVQLSHAATNPQLSNSSAFPYFLRTCPSDVSFAAGIVSVVDYFAQALAANGLLDGETHAVGVVCQADDAYSTGLTEAIQRAAISMGIAIEPVVCFVGADLPRQDAAKRAALKAIVAAPLAASNTKTIALLVTRSHSEQLGLALLDAGVADDSHVFLAAHPSVVVDMPFAFIVSFADGPPDHPARRALVADNIRNSPNETLAWPLALYDAVWSLARGLDHLISSKRSPRVVDYQDAAELIGVLREQASAWPSVSAFGGFSASSNDPETAELGVWTSIRGNLTRIGTAVGGTVTLSVDHVTLPAGAQFDFERPTHVTLGVVLDASGPVQHSDMTVTSGLEAAARHLNELVLMHRRGGERDAASSALVADVQLAIDVVDVSDARGGVAAALDRLLARAAAHPARGRHKLMGVVSQSSARTIKVLKEATPRNLAVLSATASRDSLSDPTTYPMFGRMVAGDKDQAAAIADLAKRFRWRTLATVYEAAEPYSEGLEHEFVAAARELGVTVSHRIAASSGASHLADVRAKLSATIATDVRVFVLLTLGGAACVAHQAALDAGVIGEGYMWLGGDGWATHNHCLDAGASLAVQNAVMGASQGSIGTVPARLLPGAAIAVAGIVNKTMTAPDPALVAGDAWLLPLLTQWRAQAAARYNTPGDASATFEVHYGATRAYDLMLVLSDVAARMVRARQHLDDAAVMMTHWRQTNGIVGTSMVVSFGPRSNSPSFAPISFMSRRGSSVANATYAEVGQHTDRGFLDLTGCAAGTARAGADAMAPCQPCPPDTYKPAVGDVPCTACPVAGDWKTTTAGVVGASRRDQCLCPSGMIVDDSPLAASEAFPCKACPVGGTCNRVGLHITEVLNRPGWWRGNPNATAFEPCLSRAKCSVVGLTLPAPRVVTVADGVVNVTARVFPSGWTHGTPCALGYSGVLCEVCVEGYGRQSSDGSCTPCGDRSTAISVVVMSATLTAFVVAGMAFLQLPRAKPVSARRRAANIKLLLTFFQVNSISRLYTIAWPTAFAQLLALEGEVSMASLSLTRVECLSMDVHTRSGIVMLQLFLWLPLTLLVGCAFVVASQRALRAGLRAWGRGQLAPPGRPRGSSDMLSTTISPAAGSRRFSDHSVFSPAGGATSPVVGSRRLSNRSVLSAEGGARHLRSVLSDMGVEDAHVGQSEMFDSLVVNLLNVTVFVLYPSLVRGVLSVFDCVSVPDAAAPGGSRSYLRSDFKVSCDDQEYASLFLWAAGAVVVYILGIPAMYGMLLAREHKAMFPRTVARVLQPSLPLPIVLTRDAVAISRAMRHVHAQEAWSRSLGQAKRVLRLADRTRTLSAQRDELARIARQVRSRFDSVARVVMEHAQISEAFVLGDAFKLNASPRHRARLGSDSPRLRSLSTSSRVAWDSAGHSPVGAASDSRGAARRPPVTGFGGASTVPAAPAVALRVPDAAGDDGEGARAHASVTWAPAVDDPDTVVRTPSAYEREASGDGAFPRGPAAASSAAEASPTASAVHHRVPSSASSEVAARIGSVSKAISKRWPILRPSEEEQFHRRVTELRRRLILLSGVHEDAMLAVLDGRSSLASCLQDSSKRIMRISKNQRRFGFMYAQYTQRAYWFELFLMVFKAVLSGISVALGGKGDTIVQAACAALVLTLGLHMLFVLSPSAQFTAIGVPGIYHTPSARALQRFIDKWVHKHLRRDGNSLDQGLEQVVRRGAAAKTLNAMPLYKRLPEVVTTMDLFYIALVVTLLNLLLGSIAHKDRGVLDDAAAPVESTDAATLAVAVALLLLNGGALLTFGTVIGCDAFAMVKRLRGRALRRKRAAEAEARADAQPGPR